MEMYGIYGLKRGGFQWLKELYFSIIKLKKITVKRKIYEKIYKHFKCSDTYICNIN